MSLLDTGNAVEVGVLLAALAILGFASAGAAVLTSLRRIHVLRRLATGLEAVLALEALLGSYRSALMVLRTAGTAGVVSAAVLLAADGADNHWAAVTGAAAGAGAAVLLVEVGARRLVARRQPASLRAFTAPLVVAHALLRPLTRVAPLSAEAVFLGDLHPPRGRLIDEVRQLRELAAPVDQATRLGPQEEEMLRSVAGLTQTLARDMMVPRGDMDTISTDASLQEVVDLLVTSGHSRIPLYEGSLDRIVGVLYARDVLREAMQRTTGQVDLRRLAKPAFFIPETKKAHELLREFLAKAVHIAIVVDEYGGVEGIVTLEDLVAEIVGPIREEFQQGEAPIVKLGPGEVIAEGQVWLEEVNEVLGTALAGDGFETVGGFVLHRLGRLPKAGDRFEADGVLAEVLSTEGRRVNKVRVKRVAGAEP